MKSNKILRKLSNSSSGFTLIEVMIAIGILAVSLVALNRYQTYSLRSASESEGLTTATMLARKIMAETEIEIRNTDFSEIKKSESGEFENYPGFTWKRTIEEFELTIPVPQSDDESGEDMSMLAYAQKLSDIISEHVLEVRLEVDYKILGKERNISVVTHIVDLVKDIDITL